jgi:hypothetical protein
MKKGTEDSLFEAAKSENYILINQLLKLPKKSGKH